MIKPVGTAAAATTSAPAAATFYEKAAWCFMAAAILFVLSYRLLPALLVGLLVHSVIRRLGQRLTGKQLSHSRAKLAALAIFGVVTGGLIALLVILSIGFFKGHVGELPEVYQKMADVAEHARERLEPLGIGDWIPAQDADDMGKTVAVWMRERSAEIKKGGIEVGHAAAHMLIAIVIGALVAFHEVEQSSRRPLAVALTERVRRFSDAFESIVFAQIKISAVNTVLTAIYLLAILPLFGVSLPFHKTLVAVTFITGLIPVVGNLISNTIIVIISVSVSPAVALASLLFLIVIHKLEYFLNAHIVGSEINAQAWEILLAMLSFEAAFGMAGIIIAPIVYAYTKRELVDRGMI